MNRLLFTLLIFLYGPFLFSQEIPGIKNTDLVNKNALIFNFNGFNLNAINGGIGWKKWTRDNKAICAGLQIMTSREIKDEGQDVNGMENTKIDIQLTGGVEKRFPIRHRLSPYIGGLFGFGYENHIHKIKPSERLKWSIFNPEYQNTTNTSLFYLSGYFVVGVEYFFRPNLSLSGQYQLGADFHWGEEKNFSTIFEERRDISQLNLGIRSSGLMLSIYF